VRLLRQAPASLRHGIWATAFGALVLLPVLESVGPRWAVEVLPVASEPAPSVIRVSAPAAPASPDTPAPPPAPEIIVLDAAGTAPAVPQQSAEHPIIHIERDRTRLESMPPAGVVAGPASVLPDRGGVTFGHVMLWIWGIGTVVVGLGWLGAAAGARRLVAQAQPENDEEWGVVADRARRLVGLDGPVRLLRTDALDIPIAWGYGTPAVVLPASADAWDDDRREAVLLHEMAHLRRHDAWTQAVAQVAVTVHWFNPLAWWGYRQHLDAREQACDDAVLQGGARPSAYAAHLLGVARGLKKESLSLAAVAPMARTAPLEGRIVSILDADRRRGALGRVARTLTVALTLAIVLPLAAFQPVPDTPERTALITATVDDDAPPAEATPAEETATPDGSVSTDRPTLPLEEGDGEEVMLVRLDTLDRVQESIRRAQRDVRQALAEARGAETELSRLGVTILDDVDESIRLALESVSDDLVDLSFDLEDLDLDFEQIRLDALESAQISLDGLDISALVSESLSELEEARAEMIEAEIELRDTQRELDEARRQTRGAQRQRQDARRQARDAQRQIRIDQRRTQRQVRDDQRQPVPAVPVPPAGARDRQAPSAPPPPPSLSSPADRVDGGASGDSTDVFDWDAVDDARAEALGRR
ncbi:MAG: M56 family metallopeptidase, partial [Bacteroidota bacterium]